MKFVLHILAKDMRHHWRENALFVFAGAAWIWQTIHPSGWSWLQQRELIPILFSGLWLFIVVRVVQGESLVGDREFWMTRPYRWGHLFMAKWLFIALCLNLPLLICQVILLAHAGFHFSSSLVPGLLFLQLEFAFFITFPAAALASITGTLVQWGLSVAGMMVYALVLSWLPWDKLPTALEGGENVSSLVGMFIIAPALAFVLVWQYARRRPWPARLAFGAALLVIPLIILLSSTPLVRSVAYPLSQGNPPITVSIAGDAQNGRNYTRSNSFSTAEISIPITAWTSDSDAFVDVDGMRITLTGDHGWRWQSPWINHAATFSKGSPQGTLEFSLPSDLADQMAQLHPNASVELAFGLYRMGSPHRIETANQAFDLPGRSHCTWHESDPDSGIIFKYLDCAAPFHLPPVVEFRIDSDTNTCAQSAGDSPLPAGHSATDVEYGSDLPADFDPNPVQKINFSYGNWLPLIPSPGNPRENLSARLCRGTPITVRTGSLIGKMRATFNLGMIGAEKLVKPDSDSSAAIRFDPKFE